MPTGLMASEFRTEFCGSLINSQMIRIDFQINYYPKSKGTVYIYSKIFCLSCGVTSCLMVAGCLATWLLVVWLIGSCLFGACFVCVVV